MATDLRYAASLFGPLFMGLVFHGLCIKFGWLRFAARPIDVGHEFRGRPLFGANKTFRGVLAVAVGAAAGYLAQGLVPSWQVREFQAFPAAKLGIVGFGIGAAAMLSELPNSFLKRQLGVAPGAPARGALALMFYVLDQVDVLFGAWLVVLPWITPTPSRVSWSIVFVVVVHQAVSFVGAALGMRASAR